MKKDDPVAKHVQVLVDSFERQVTKGRVRRFVFPSPADSVEFEAVCLFIASIEEKVGRPTRLSVTPGSHITLTLPSRWQPATNER